jgi:hypothetical protein
MDEKLHRHFDKLYESFYVLDKNVTIKMARSDTWAKFLALSLRAVSLFYQGDFIY